MSATSQARLHGVLGRTSICMNVFVPSLHFLLFPEQDILHKLYIVGRGVKETNVHGPFVPKCSSVGCGVAHQGAAQPYKSIYRVWRSAEGCAVALKGVTQLIRCGVTHLKGVAQLIGQCTCLPQGKVYFGRMVDPGFESRAGTLGGGFAE